MNPSILIFASALLLPIEARAYEDFAEAAGRFDWIPSTLDLPDAEPYKDFYVHSIVFEKTPNGTFRMAIKLPEDISAGESTVLELSETERILSGDPDFPTTQFIFKGGNASAVACTVSDSWLFARCEVRFLDIPKTAQERTAYVTAKYKGTEKERGLSDVAFNIEAEPFGDLLVSPVDDINSGSLLGNGSWNFSYQNTRGSWTSGTMTVDFDRGVYKPVGSLAAALLTGFIYTNNVAEGTWTFSEDTFGWFKFTFSEDSFTGVWGTYDSTTPLGQWNGSRR